MLRHGRGEIESWDFLKESCRSSVRNQFFLLSAYELWLQSECIHSSSHNKDKPLIPRHMVGVPCAGPRVGFSDLWVPSNSGHSPS